MRMMTDGLKLSAGNALRSILQSWTRTNARGLAAGILITAIVQSSSVVTVATVGFVNAELLALAQAVWVVFGANVGMTMTGWLVALVGVKADGGALAPPLIGVRPAACGARRGSRGIRCVLSRRRRPARRVRRDRIPCRRLAATASGVVRHRGFRRHRRAADAAHAIVERHDRDRIDRGRRRHV